MNKNVLIGIMLIGVGAFVRWVNRNKNSSFKSDLRLPVRLPEKLPERLPEKVPVKPYVVPTQPALRKSIETTYVGWEIPPEGEIYKQALVAAALVYTLPKNLLARVAFQESNFRPDIISGKTKSSAGAIGIMQIIPKWHPDVNPLDPMDSIHYAAKYLRKLYDQLGTWPLALAAYNWGIGNLLNKGIDKAPAETRRYVDEILSDINFYKKVG